MSEGRRTNKEPPSTRNGDRANGEESREKGSSSSANLSISSARDTLATDHHQKPRLPDGSQSSKFDKPRAAAAGASSLGSRVAGNSSTLGQSSDTRTAWRLPELQDINVEALESQLAQNSLTEEEFVSGLKVEVEGRLSPTNVHDNESECDKFLDQVNCRLMSHIQDSAATTTATAAVVTEWLEEGEKGEENAVAAAAESPLVPGEGRRVTFGADVVAQDSKLVTFTADVVAAQDSKVTSAEAHAEEGHQLQQGGHLVLSRRPRNSIMTCPNRALSDLLQNHASRSEISRSEDSVWKSFQDDSSKQPQKSIQIISGSLHEKFDQTSAYSNRPNSKSLDEAFAAAARQVLWSISCDDVDQYSDLEDFIALHPIFSPALSSLMIREGSHSYYPIRSHQSSLKFS